MTYGTFGPVSTRQSITALAPAGSCRATVKADTSIPSRTHLPDQNPTRGGVLRVGNVITLEPGAYHESLGGGVRLENMYLITEEGAENLSEYPMTPIPVTKSLEVVTTQSRYFIRRTSTVRSGPSVGTTTMNG